MQHTPAISMSKQAATRTAKGIPDFREYGDLDKLKAGQLLNYYIQEHHADRSGLHRDVRAGTPDTDLFSFATRKELPEPGGRVALHRQPLHSFSYGEFQGRIPSGYGKGTVKQQAKGELLITNTTPDAIHFSTVEGTQSKRYALVKPRDPESKAWLLVHAYPPGKLGLEKQHMQKLTPEQADSVMANLSEHAAVQPKIDGALTFMRLANDRAELYSHRTSKRTGQPITHTERFFGGSNAVKVPPKFKNTTVMGEMYGERDGKMIPVQELSGLLNSGIGKSIRAQREKSIQLKAMLLGMAHANGQDYQFKEPHETDRAAMEELLPYLPKDKFTLPEEAKTPEAAKLMLAQIIAGEHPQTREGVVIYPEEGRPQKVKPPGEHKVHIRNIHPGEGRLEGVGAGTFDYSHEPEGPIAGRVGSGLSDEMRQQMQQRPEEFVGRVARVMAQEKFPSGALRAPVFHSLHEG